MKSLSILSLIFLSACGLVHIEIRDKHPKVEKTTEQKPRQDIKKEEKTTLLRVQAPVKGRATPTERGYYIITSCAEFFRSVSDGKVLYVGDDIRNYGWVIMVESTDGLVYVYGRADSSLVRKGEMIKRGQPLGKVGKSSEGCGLLFEIRNSEGKPINFQLML